MNKPGRNPPEYLWGEEGVEQEKRREDPSKQFKIATLIEDKAAFMDFLDQARTQPLRDERGVYTGEEAKIPILGMNHTTAEQTLRGWNRGLLEELNQKELAPEEKLSEGMRSVLSGGRRPIQSKEIIAELNNYLYRQGVYNDYEMAHARGRGTLLQKGMDALESPLGEEGAEAYNTLYGEHLYEVLREGAQEILEENHIRVNSARQARNEWDGREGCVNSKGYPVRAWDGFSKDNPRVKSQKFYEPKAKGEVYQRGLISRLKGGKEVLENLESRAKLFAFSNLAKGLYGSAGHYFRDEYQAFGDALKGQLSEVLMAGVLDIPLEDLKEEVFTLDNFDGGVDLVDNEGVNHQIKSSRERWGEQVSDLKGSEMRNLKRNHPDSLVHFVGFKEGEDRHQLTLTEAPPLFY